VTGWNSWDEMTQELPRLPPAFFDDPLFKADPDQARPNPADPNLAHPDPAHPGPADPDFRAGGPPPVRDVGPASEAATARIADRPLTDEPPTEIRPPLVPPGPGQPGGGHPGGGQPGRGRPGPGRPLDDEPPTEIRPPLPPGPADQPRRWLGRGGAPTGRPPAYPPQGLPPTPPPGWVPGTPLPDGDWSGRERPGRPGRPDPGRPDPGRPDPGRWGEQPGDRATWDPLGDETVVIRFDPGAVAPAPAPVTEKKPAGPSLGRASRTMAIASAASRLTGFLRSLAIAAAIGVLLVGNAYNTANTLPNIVYELLLGGVLTSVVVPLLVHAQERDPDGGEQYTQRLLTVTLVALAGATLVATLAAPLLTAAYVPTGGDKADLTTFFAYLLLPEIFFYGLGAMIGAILNTRGVFGAPAWAPVLNNVVVIAVAAVFLVVTAGDGRRTTESLGTGEVLLLGVGTTLGIVVQAIVLLPALRRTGFRWRLRWDLRGSRLGEAGGLAAWVVGYVVVSQVGYFVQVRMANGVRDGEPGQAVLTFASLLFQMPYGILGVSLLTALMPRMSRAAARGDRASVLSDLSLGARLSALALLPVTALFVVLGPAIGTVVFGHGRTEVHEARDIGTVLAVSAFGLVPFAITMLQLRVFYAVKDARTPTWINVGMVGVKVVLSLLAAAVLDDRHLVAGLMVATSLSYLVGAVVGEALLRRRFGALDTARTVRASTGFAVLSAAAGLAAWAVLWLVSRSLGTGVAGSFAAVVGGSVVAIGVFGGLAVLSRSPELDDVLRGLRGKPARRPRDTPPPPPPPAPAPAWSGPPPRPQPAPQSRPQPAQQRGPQPAQQPRPQPAQQPRPPRPQPAQPPPYRPGPPPQGPPPGTYGPPPVNGHPPRPPAGGAGRHRADRE
jgi:putative peptidoglycan lipid II flippase